MVIKKYKEFMNSKFDDRPKTRPAKILVSVLHKESTAGFYEKNFGPG